MGLILIQAEEVIPGDLMEDWDRTWKPVTHVENPASSAWFWFRVSQQGVRMAMRGSLVMVSR